MSKIRVCQLSDAHKLYDDRIYWKYGISLVKHGFEVIYISINDKNIDFITEESIRLIGIPNKIYFKNKYLNKAYKVLFKKDITEIIFEIACSLKADIYHFHNIRLLDTAKKLKKQSFKPIVIYDPREPYAHNIRSSILHVGLAGIFKNWYAGYIDKKEKSLSRLFDFIIPNEDNVAKSFIPYVGENKVDVIYNYSDLNPEFVRLEFDKKKYDAIYCGNISKNRGAITILEIARYLKKIKGDITILLLGVIHEVSLKQEMLDYIKLNDLKDNVIIKDFVPYKEVHNFYLQSKVGLILFKPFYSYKIILPIKLFEYMTYGLPIVCSNFGQIKEYTLNYNAGMIVDPENIEETGNAILKILEDKNLYYKYSDNGINAAKTRFTWNIMEEKLISIYNFVLHKANKPQLRN